MDCDDHLRERIAERLAAFPLHRASPDGCAAAVALTLVEEGFGADLPGMPVHPRWQRGAALVLTRRSATLRDHAGQWALPGGRLDPGETPEEAARRELAEEVGLGLGEDAILGRLDDFATRSGFAVTPVVVWAGPGARLTPNEDEVDSVHRLPVSELLRDDAPMLDHDAGGTAPVLHMPLGDSWVAAPTAAFLYQFAQVCLLGRATRVAHYEQPRFAWR